MAGPSWILISILIYAAVSLRLSDACLPVPVPNLKLADEIKTFAKTEGKVLHMEADLRYPGSILYSEGASLKTTDGPSTKNIAGDSHTQRFMNASNKDARFSDITGFHQLNRDVVIVVDKFNHCLRKVNRETGITSRFAGRCGFEGDKDGMLVDALFFQPTGVFGPVGVNSHESSVVEHEGKSVNMKIAIGNLFVTDTGNMALRQIHPEGMVETLSKSDNLQGLNFLHPFFLVGDTKKTLHFVGFVTTDHGIFFLNTQEDKVELAVGTEGVPSPGLFKMNPIAPSPKQFLFSGSNSGSSAPLNNMGMFFLDGSNRLKIAKLGDDNVVEYCSDIVGTIDSSHLSCQLDQPSSLLALDESLFIGQQGAIRVIPGKGSALDIPGSLLPASIPPPATCKSQNMTIYLKPGQVYADAQPTSDINLRLSAGSHVYQDKSKDCTVHIQVFEPGKLRRRLTLITTYKVECDLIRDDLGKSVLQSNMEEIYKKIEEACVDIPACVRPSKTSAPDINCNSGVMTVAWPTNITYTREVTSVPTNTKTEIEKKLTLNGVAFSAVIIRRSPPVQRPEKTIDGNIADVTLTTFCVENATYDSLTDSCQDA